MVSRIKISSVVKGLGQSVLSLSFNLGGMLAGTYLALFLDVFSVTPWALLLFPGILSMRGVIGGVFCGRLSTALHLGTIKASYTNNTKSFSLLLSTIVTFTLVSSVTLGLVTSLYSGFLLGTPATEFLIILGVIVTTMGLSLVFICPLTLGISVLSFRRGLDPDVIVYPVISTVADIFVTVIYVLVLKSVYSSHLGLILIWGVVLIFLFSVCYILSVNYREGEFVKMVKEFLLTITLVAIIVNITGSALSKVSQVIGGKPEIYMVYPAVIDTVGDVGSIVGSTATTKLALGLIRSSFTSMKQHLVEIGSAWSGSLVMFTLYTIIASSIQGSTISEFWKLMLRLLLTNLLAVSVIVVIAFAVAIYSMRRGWDPDSFVIPIESSLADGVTTISLLFALGMVL